MNWEDHVRAVRAAPDDDAPRLRCGRWLRDRGSSRGEFIEVDCRLAALAPGDPARAGLAIRRAGLLDERAWFAPLLEAGARDLRVNRGFVESVRLAGRSVAGLGLVCRSEPVLGLRLTSGGPGPMRAAAAAPELAGVRELVIDGRHAEGTEVLLASPALAGLESLWLAHPVSPLIAAAVTSGAARPRKLHLRLDRDAASRLARSDFLSRVTGLSLDRADDDTLTELAVAPMAGLRSLSLWQATAGPRGLAALVPFLGQLTAFSFTGARLDPAAVPVLTAHMAGGRLRRLEIAGDRCDALAGFLTSPAMSGVGELILAYGPFTAPVAAALRRSGHRDSLRSMWIPGADPNVRESFHLPGVEIETEGW